MYDNIDWLIASVRVEAINIDTLVVKGLLVFVDKFLASTETCSDVPSIMCVSINVIEFNNKTNIYQYCSSNRVNVVNKSGPVLCGLILNYLGCILMYG